MASKNSFLHGGECAALIAARDWSSTSLGAIEAWPAALRATVANMIHSRQPMLLFLGPELIQFYNDAFVPSFGVGKHPSALGQPARECWRDAWPVVGAQIEAVIADGTPAWHEDALVPIERNGRMEEVFWTYSYSPAFDDEGVVSGALVIVTEVTARVLAARRLDALARLGLTLASVTSRALAVEALVATARVQREDMPFVVVRDHTGVRAQGIAAAAAASLLGSLVEYAHGIVDLADAVQGAVWPEPVSAAFVAAPAPSGPPLTIVFGLSPRLPADEHYLSYLSQAAAQVTSTTRRLDDAEKAAAILRERDDLLLRAPVAAALLAGPDHVFVLANPLFCQLARRNPLGQSLRDAFPELASTSLPATLDQVYRDGTPHSSHELRVALARAGDGTLEDRYFNFNLEPLRDPTGAVLGMMAVAVEMTDQVLARRALERADAAQTSGIEALREASRAKDDLLARLGHELRNPLAPVMSALEILDRKDSASTTARERALIAKHLCHMIRLVDDLIDVSRAARGELALQPRRAELGVLVAAAVEAIKPLLDSKEQHLDVEVRPGLLVDVDEARVIQVISNLLVNGAKYTPPGGTIRVCGERDGAKAVLTVSDTGVGIPPVLLTKVFEPFAQGERSMDARDGGLGLGLAIVKSIVTQHGGSIAAESRGVGHGSAFTVRLPLAGPTSDGAAGGGVSYPPASLRILVVDDNVDAAEMLGELLTLCGHVVRVATAPSEALTSLADFAPEVALLDIGMPGMDGFTLGSLLRSRVPSCRLIAITGFGEPSHRDRARRLGFAALLVKPVSVDEIVAALQRS